MNRSLLVLVLVGALAWLVIRLIRTLGQIMPGDAPHRPIPPGKRKIIDAEFEDVDQDDSSES